ncbi:AraC family transcriptional regulator [Rhizobium halophytocola]|uniref:AraC-like DNA-binding protein n=1 Tax=Rhizobium halophytocola TaxID=735519 RepID=A0ABS4DW05_9HYPH|nr:AraC family transcriptional regulator [Rhizobium halophytocola]MBP1849873.1 AraC-like DNA-binding protein [Rhizobium halophytocola]
MIEELLQALRGYAERQSGDSPFVTTIDGVIVLRADHARPPSHLIHKPALCAVVQGAKVTSFGDRDYAYAAGKALVVSVEMPACGRVVAASPDEPFLGVVIEFDPGIMQEVMEGLDEPPAASGEPGAGALVADLDDRLADCVLRAVRLLETPKAIPMLYPAVMREICYWLLTGPHGGEIARLTLGNSHARRIVDAVHFLRDRFAETLRIDDLAAVAQLSPSAFHRQFKALTAMTPLQYQKRLRLLEARRLMLSGALNVETAAFQVGYESPSQFSREYARLFGTPPKKDITDLRQQAA